MNITLSTTVKNDGLDTTTIITLTEDIKYLNGRDAECRDLIDLMMKSVRDIKVHKGKTEHD